MSELKSTKELTKDRPASLKHHDPQDPPPILSEVPPEGAGEPFDIKPLPGPDQQKPGNPSTGVALGDFCNEELPNRGNPNASVPLPEGNLERVTIALMQFLDGLTGAHVLDATDETHKRGWFQVKDLSNAGSCLNTIFSEIHAFILRKQAQGIPLTDSVP